MNLPEPPDLDTRLQIPYESIRYIAGYHETIVKQYALQYARSVIADNRPDDSTIIELANEVHRAMPDDADDQTEMLAIVHAVLDYIDKPQIYRHNKTQGRYKLIGHGKLQTDHPLYDLSSVVMYRSLKDGTPWARVADEFTERFTRDE